MSYTTIRISREDRERLRRIAKLLNKNSLAETLRYLISLAERELDRQEGKLKNVISSLKYAKDIGPTNAEDVDRYLYGGESDSTN